MIHNPVTIANGALNDEIVSASKQAQGGPISSDSKPQTAMSINPFIVHQFFCTNQRVAVVLGAQRQCESNRSLRGACDKAFAEDFRADRDNYATDFAINRR